MKRKSEHSDIKTKFEFSTGLRFELFFGVQALVDEKSRIHSNWKKCTLQKLPPDFHKSLKKLGNSPDIWGVVADTLRTQPANLPFEEIISELKNQDIKRFQREILFGELHYQDVVSDLMSGKATLQQGVGKIPKAKQEWLAFTGLYPYQADSPIVIALEFLLASPEAFRKTVIYLLETFWTHAFKDTWDRLQPQLSRSLQEKERLFESCSFGEFSKQALLRIEVNEQKELIKAVRGGYELAFKDLKAGHLLPSLFNDKRLWTAFEEGPLTVVYFPYFDPSITLDLSVVGATQTPVDPELDAALIFKTLGDTTRYAILSIIAKHPKSSVELAKLLSVSKPTISHHVHLLRDSGLINETYSNGSVILSVKREVFENLSEVALKSLFSQPRIEMKSKRRSKS